MEIKKRPLRLRDFVLADSIEGIVVSYRLIARQFPELIPLIKEADSQNKTYIVVNIDGLREIQWEYK